MVANSPICPIIRRNNLWLSEQALKNFTNLPIGDIPYVVCPAFAVCHSYPFTPQCRKTEEGMVFSVLEHFSPHISTIIRPYLCCRSHVRHTILRGRNMDYRDGLKCSIESYYHGIPDSTVVSGILDKLRR
jgi:hypothetical protein